MGKKTQDKKLFSEFPPIPTSQWEEKIIADLKGADYEKKLIWKTDEGINVKPYYSAEDLNGLEYLSALPDEPPFIRGVKKHNNTWIIRQDIDTDDIAEANRIALDAISRGVNAIGLNAEKVTSHNQMQQILKGIDISKNRINFISSHSYPLTLELFIHEITHRKLEGTKITGSLNFDVISYLLTHGDFYQSERHNLDEAKYLVQTIREKLPGFHAITVNGHLFHNSGATLVQELAFSLASGNEYLADLTSEGLSIDDISDSLQFSFGIGSNYFMEIAKLRAARLLWNKIVEQYRPANPENSKMFIHSTTSLWNKTIYDPYVNLLRTTTEGMSAIIGNTDSLSIFPFDFPYKYESEFSRRIARNQQLILKEEAYLDKIVDPGAGSYYIENLTHSIAANAWEQFKTIEEEGGMIECIKTGFIQDEIEKACIKKNMDIAQRKIVILGTNQYPNSQESMAENIEKLSKTPDESSSIYKKLHIYRGAHAFEEIRLATEHAASRGMKKLSVFLLTLGNPEMRRARATFAANFFGCAGYQIIDNPGFKTIKDGIKAAVDSKAGIIVICSSDAEYATISPSVCQGIRSQNKDVLIFVAGYPKEIVEKLRSKGIDDFIHIRTNILEFLKNLQKKFRIQ